MSLTVAVVEMRTPVVVRADLAGFQNLRGLRMWVAVSGIKATVIDRRISVVGTRAAVVARVRPVSVRCATVSRLNAADLHQLPLDRFLA